MGLDITAYSNLQKIPAVIEEWEAFDPVSGILIDDALVFYVNPAFPGRAHPIESDAAYHCVNRFSFNAGSYSGYNRWRERLAMLAGYPMANDQGETSHAAGAWRSTSGPFWELIHFADNEGVLGSVVCTKLATDFAAHQEEADQVTDDSVFGEYSFRALYRKWRTAIELAADSGAVKFH